jgi:hypothetical protein
MPYLWIWSGEFPPMTKEIQFVGRSIFFHSVIEKGKMEELMSLPTIWLEFWMRLNRIRRRNTLQIFQEQ